MLSIRITFISVLGILFIESATTASMYDLVVKRIQCNELIPDYINTTCSVNLINRTTTYIQIKVVPQHDLVDLKFKITLLYKFSVYRKFLIDVTEDFCGLAKGGKSAPVISLVWNTLKKSSNLADGCPMIKNETYYVKDYVFDVSNFPAGLPTGNYRIDILILNSADQKNFLKIEIFAEITRKLEADIQWN